MPSTTWLITGASSGFGHHLAQRVLDEGADVIAVARRGDRLGTIKAAAGRLTTLVLDITAPHAEDELRRAIEAHGRLDVLVNNAGLGLFGSVEQTSDIEARMVMDTNFFGMLNALRAALPALRASKGRIVQMSSLLGRLAWPSSGLYSASKAAVELMSEALALEIAPSGIRVTIIEPGTFNTDFSASAHLVAPDGVYAPTVGAFLTAFAQRPADSFGDPADVVTAVMQTVAMPEPPLRRAVGQDAITGIRTALEAQLAELSAG
jgi:NAD(P)-dependent dehydrogenase (short-subunit alcohol dehydrogenase family)